MFTPDQIQHLQYGRFTVAQTYYRLMSACFAVTSPNPRTREYLLHGFLRRLGTLQRCIQNVYSIYPPERSDIPTQDETTDLAINLQSFVFNVFGCIDNLAWVWGTETKLTTESGGQLTPTEISFQKKRLRKTLPPEFRTYLEGLRNWFEYMEGFRHALAHRIPLYIPPYTVSPAVEEKHNELERQKGLALQRRDFDEYERLDAEQTRLGRFTPAMTHSHSEGSPAVCFHAQILADWNTVAEIAEKFLAQLNSYRCAAVPDPGV